MQMQTLLDGVENSLLSGIFLSNFDRFVV